jgi:hypothetical protein
MSVRRGWLRLLIGSWALLQLAVGPALALVDGQSALTDAGVGAVAHVEAHSTPKCQPPHGADCGLCQFLSTHTANARSLAVAIPVLRQLTAAPDWLWVHPGATEAAPSQSRAPPIS